MTTDHAGTDRATRLLIGHSVALLAGLILALLVHAWGGDELVLCDDVRGTSCAQGSGASWTWTGGLLVTPLLALTGFLWTERLERSDLLGPFSKTPMPDWEEWVEGIAVVVAGLLTLVLIRSGPKVPMLDTSWFNSVLSGHLGSEAGADLVPSRSAWFAIGALVAAPFAFSFGSATGREWFRWKRQRAENAQ